MLARSGFELSKSDGTVIGTSKTDSNGYATFSNLYQGTYNLKEISSNANYVLNSEVIKVNAEYNKRVEPDKMILMMRLLELTSNLQVLMLLIKIARTSF